MSVTTITPYEIMKYYGDLLIIQYNGKEKARAQIEASASALIQPQVSEYSVYCERTPTAGDYTLTLQDGTVVGTFGPFADSSDIEAAFHLITGYEEVTVSGNLQNTEHKYTVKFTGVTPIVAPLVITDNTLLDFNGDPMKLSTAQADLVLPLAVQNAFNLIGDDVAVGVQLDVLGKYIGIPRTGPGFTGQITLTDHDYLSLLQLGIARNNLGSSLYDIDTFITIFFQGNILVFDLANMHMTYMLSTAVGSMDFVQRVIVGNLLPKPMGVGLGLIIYAPVVTNFFGFRTYEAEAPSSTPFNTYEDYRLDWFWLDYAYGLFF